MCLLKIVEEEKEKKGRGQELFRSRRWESWKNRGRRKMRGGGAGRLKGRLKSDRRGMKRKEKEWGNLFWIEG